MKTSQMTSGWTPYAKRQVALDMYHRACSFIGSALLLEKNDGSPMVVSHLFCQGVELLFKAILLLIDYDKYYPKLRKIGHNLLRGAEEVHDAVGLNFCDGPVGAELGKLNSFYMQHMLRYATLLGLLHGAASIQFDHVFRRTAAVVRLTSRKIRELPAP